MRRADRDLALAVALVGAFMAWNALSDVLFQRLQLGALSLHEPLRLSILLLGAAVTLLGIVWLGCVRLGLGSLRALGWTARGRPGWMLAFGLLQTVCFSLMAFTAAAALLGGREGIGILATAATTMPASERTFYVIMGSKVSFVEESLFRGFLLQSLSAKWGLVAAIVLSSVLFAVFHRLTSPPFLLLKFLFGAVSAVSVVLTRSLIPTAIAHAALWAIFGDA